MRAVDVRREGEPVEVRRQPVVVVDEEGEGDRRVDLPHGFEGARVEGLDRRAVEDAVALEDVVEGASVGRWQGREHAVPRGARLDLDVVADRAELVGAVVALGEVEHIVEEWLDGRHRLLAGEARVTTAAAVELLDLGVGHVAEAVGLLLVLGDRRAVGPRADLGVEPRLVREEDLPVGRDDRVHLQRRHAQVEGVAHRRKAVLREQTPPAAVPLDIEARRRAEEVGHGRREPAADGAVARHVVVDPVDEGEITRRDHADLREVDAGLLGLDRRPVHVAVRRRVGADLREHDGQARPAEIVAEVVDVAREVRGPGVRAERKPVERLQVVRVALALEEEDAGDATHRLGGADALQARAVERRVVQARVPLLDDGRAHRARDEADHEVRVAGLQRVGEGARRAEAGTGVQRDGIDLALGRVDGLDGEAPAVVVAEDVDRRVGRLDLVERRAARHVGLAREHEQRQPPDVRRVDPDGRLGGDGRERGRDEQREQERTKAGHGQGQAGTETGGADTSPTR